MISLPYVDCSTKLQEYYCTHLYECGTQGGYYGIFEAEYLERSSNWDKRAGP